MAIKVQALTDSFATLLTGSGSGHTIRSLIVASGDEAQDNIGAPGTARAVIEYEDTSATTKTLLGDYFWTNRESGDGRDYQRRSTRDNTYLTGFELPNGDRLNVKGSGNIIVSYDS